MVAFSSVHKGKAFKHQDTAVEPQVGKGDVKRASMQGWGIKIYYIRRFVVSGSNSK